MTSLVYMLLIITKLFYVMGHTSHHHTSHTSSTSHYSHYSDYSNSLHKPFIIKRIVVPTIVYYYVFMELDHAIKDDFEENEIYWVVNISSLVLNNNDGEDCIYYSVYPNKNNETIILALSDVINYNSSLNNDNLSQYCVRSSLDDIYYKYFTIIFVVLFCFCGWCYGLCEHCLYNKSVQLY